CYVTEGEVDGPLRPTDERLTKTRNQLVDRHVAMKICFHLSLSREAPKQIAAQTSKEETQTENHSRVERSRPHRAYILNFPKRAGKRKRLVIRLSCPK